MLRQIKDPINAGLSRIQFLSGNQLKMIAAICMLVDHVTKVFYSSIALQIFNPMLDAGQMTWEQLKYIEGFMTFLCGIGMIAFPLFAFTFAEGFAHTHSKMRYLLRLTVFALTTEFFFDTTFFSGVDPDTWPWYWWHQNVFFTYLLALCALWLMEQVNKLRIRPLSFLLQGMIVLAVCFVAQFYIRGDYGGFGVFLIIVIYLLRKNRLLQVVGMLLAKFIIEGWYRPNSFLFSLRNYEVISFLISLVLILLYNGKRGEKNLKPFFYGFYPIHIAIIGFLDWLIFTVFWEAMISG